MLREAGLDEMQILRTPLVPTDSTASDPFSHLAQFDQQWRARVAAARGAGQCWVYLASFDGHRTEVGPVRVDCDSPFATLAGSGNLARIVLAGDPDTPLTVHGPGAGIEVTAGAVLADLRQAAAGFN